MRYGMVIDTAKCIGCHVCVMACKVENNTPNGVWWNRIITDNGGGFDADMVGGTYPNNLKLRYYAFGCQHCQNPACVKVCPVGATYKDPETGVVRQDYDKCIGCRMCMAACPYTGVRSFNWEEPKYTLDYATGDKDIPAHQKHVVEKCTFCWHRLASGKEPACMHLCVGRARFWGDMDDPNSIPNQKMKGREVKTLLPEKGTRPPVYYLV